jgi:membrane protein DedA with SNARE-associated domain
MLKNMDTYIAFVCEYAPQAPWIIFCLLMLAGLNVPISEDLLLLTGGAMASSCDSAHIFSLFIWTYVGCWVSAWEAYALGRFLGPKLYKIPWFNYLLSPTRVERLHVYYEKFGIFTFIVGRFIPGGVRNALFITSGMGKMPFLTFIIRDGVACLVSTSVIFYGGYLIGQNLPLLLETFETYRHGVYVFMILGVSCLGISLLLRKKSQKCDDTP